VLSGNQLSLVWCHAACHGSVYGCIVVVSVVIIGRPLPAHFCTVSGSGMDPVKKARYRESKPEQAVTTAFMLFIITPQLFQLAARLIHCCSFKFLDGQMYLNLL